MKALWITNILFPEAESMLTGQGELKSSGGWMLGAAKALLNMQDIDLTVATVSRRVKKITYLQGEKIAYYVLPLGKGNTRKNDDYIPLWKEIEQSVQPDIVHIHGTEFSHGLAYIDACGAENVVISIQGLTSSSYYYYEAGLTFWEIFRSLTLRDIIRGGILKGKHNFWERGKYEIETIQKVKHIIGRTEWDRAHTWAINPNAQYHFCNEILRDDFYDESSWNYETCDKQTIFLSQARYPLKGLHQLLHALPIILKHYPNCKVRIAGVDITRNSSLKEKIRYGGYGKLIKKLINKYQLHDKITFVGSLNATEMKAEYLKSNVFVCPSSIENSPNSLGEAQLLGVPVIASYVGGVPDMMKGNEENLYRFDEIEMLAYKVCKIFEAKEKQISTKKEARDRHNRETNTKDLIGIYRTIIEG